MSMRTASAITFVTTATSGKCANTIRLGPSRKAFATSFLKSHTVGRLGSVVPQSRDEDPDHRSLWLRWQCSRPALNRNAAWRLDLRPGQPDASGLGNESEHCQAP